MEITSRASALERGLTYYFTGLPCVNGHVSKRNTKNRACYVCICVARDKWHDTHKDKSREYSQRHRRNSPDKRKATVRQWKTRHPDKVNANTAYRRQRRRMATPAWLTPAQVKQISTYYTYAKVKERITGVKHHVDHIVPVRGESVCGLHVPWNLQVITATQNLQKNNRF